MIATARYTAHTFSCINSCFLQFCLVSICQRSLIFKHKQRSVQKARERTPVHTVSYRIPFQNAPEIICQTRHSRRLQKGGVPAAPSGTATLLRLSPNHQFHPRPPLAVADFRCPRLSWLDGRCVQGPGTYSPRHG